MAEQRARNSLPEGMFDTLPDIVKQTIIDKEQQLIDQEPIVAEARVRKEYQERQARGFERSKQQMAEYMANRPERIGYGAPTRMNLTEQDHIDMSSEFNTNEPDPVSYLGGLVHGFRASTIINLVPQMQEIINQANSHEEVQRSITAYIMFHIWTGNAIRASTPSIPVSSGINPSHIDKLYEALAVLIADIEKLKGAYESIYEGNRSSYIHFYFRANYYPQPRSIDNWGSNIKAIEEREFFDIFTANGETNCIEQIADRLFNKGHNINKIEHIIAKLSPKVCIVKPHSSIVDIHGIKDYSDLVVELNSPVSSLSVIDPKYIYLLHFNEHVGLLINTKEQKRIIDHVRFRPVMKYPKTQRITMCFDIECYFDPEGDQKHVPYLCCACFIYDDVPGNVMEFEGRDCIAQMIDYAADNVSQFKLNNIELIAHNGGGYDFHYLLTSMYNPSIVKNILIRNNHFISFTFKHKEIQFNVKDSLNFLLCSLSKAAQSFLDETDRKTDFPHHEARSEADLAKVFNEWLSVDKEISVNTEKEKMIISYQDVVTYKDNINSKSLLDWSKLYCVNDVIVLAKVWIKFKSTVSDIFNCKIVDQTYTLAGLSFRLFEAHLPPKIKLYNPIKADFDKIRQSLIGGRCISVNGFYSNVACLDVKSLYPAAMAYYNQPYGNYRKVTAEIESECGIYYCKVEPVNIVGHGFFPLRKDGNVSYSSIIKEYTAWYTSVDIQIGREEGHKITVICFENKYVGYSWKHKGLIFKEYIESVLYKLKLQYEQTNQPEHRHIIKIIMNALWGKFAQKWMEDTYSIKDESKGFASDSDQCYKLWDTDWFLVKHKDESKQYNKPIQNGVFTLSWARYHMYRLWKAAVKPNTQCLYSDTDSMMIPRSSLVRDAKIEIDGQILPVIGSAMGQLEVEYNFDDLICVGKKQYIGKYVVGDKILYKKRFKGIPMQYITPELYTHLLESKDHTVQVNFLKFKREWGSVSGYMESKTVKQT